MLCRLLHVRPSLWIVAFNAVCLLCCTIVLAICTLFSKCCDTLDMPVTVVECRCELFLLLRYA